MAQSLPNQLANLKSKIRIAVGLKWVEAIEKMIPPQNPQELAAFMKAADTFLNKICDANSIVHEDDDKKSVEDLQKQLKGDEEK